MSKLPEELYAERKKRILDAATLAKPDRIPIMLPFGYMLAKLGRITYEQLECDLPKQQFLLEQAAQYYDGDMVAGLGASPVPSTLLGDRTTKWAGKDLKPDSPFQFVESEYMRVEDYDAFLDDPSDFAIRQYLPRVFGALEGLSQLLPLGMWLFGYYNLRNSAVLAAPAVVAAAETLGQVAQFFVQYGATMEENVKRLAVLGYPTGLLGGILVEAPFDFMADTLRGMRGIFLDMHRCPDKLLAAEDKVARFQVDAAISAARRTGRMFATFPLHRGSDGFMSLEQFERFYWPQLKWMLMTLIDVGITPYIYWEGIWNQRLKYLRELPRGKTIGYFQFGDLFKAKEIVGDTMCIIGGMPNSLLQGGAPEEIRQYTKKLCDVMGQNGGYIMAPSVMTMDDCDPDLVKVWVDATKEYGAY